ncbi:MAG: hypothetical protein WD077_07175 [Bacteroidia bacterium]
MKVTFTALFWMAAMTGVFAQPSIVSLAPASAIPGQQLNIIIMGVNTHFQQGLTQVQLGDGISVQSIQVQAPDRLSALVEIDASAADGFRQVVVTTASERAEMDAAFEIFDASSGARAILTLLPADVMYLSDFAADNLQAAPILFNISVINGAVEEALKLRLEVYHSDYNKILTASKNLGTIQPNQVVLLDNRDLEDYTTTGGSKALLDEANKTGVLPPGAYTYKLILMDGRGNVIAEDEAFNTITNTLTGLELIGPGTPLSESPEVIFNNFPMFQWFSASNEFSLQLFEVRPQQSSPDDIADNFPVYEQQGIFNSFFQYPNSAEILEEGKTYAWRITATFFDSRGKQTKSSELFWFSYKSASGEHLQAERIEIAPANQTMKIGQARQFSATGFDKEGNEVPLQVKWQVIPADGGTIDANGLFRAGTQPKPVAIVAEYGGIKEHTSVILEWNPEWLENQFMDKFLKEVFGLQH